jgi:hypothetical protein
MSTGSNWLVTAGAAISLRDDSDLTDRRLFAWCRRDQRHLEEWQRQMGADSMRNGPLRVA